jgi:hypothetical protein
MELSQYCLHVLVMSLPIKNAHTLETGHELLFICDDPTFQWNGFCFNCCISHMFGCSTPSLSDKLPTLMLLKCAMESLEDKYNLDFVDDAIFEQIWQTLGSIQEEDNKKDAFQLIKWFFDLHVPERLLQRSITRSSQTRTFSDSLIQLPRAVGDLISFAFQTLQSESTTLISRSSGCSSTEKKNDVGCKWQLLFCLKVLRQLLERWLCCSGVFLRECKQPDDAGSAASQPNRGNNEVENMSVSLFQTDVLTVRGRLVQLLLLVVHLGYFSSPDQPHTGRSGRAAGGAVGSGYAVFSIRMEAISCVALLMSVPSLTGQQHVQQQQEEEEEEQRDDLWCGHLEPTGESELLLTALVRELRVDMELVLRHVALGASYAAQSTPTGVVPVEDHSCIGGRHFSGTNYSHGQRSSGSSFFVGSQGQSSEIHTDIGAHRYRSEVFTLASAVLLQARPKGSIEASFRVLLGNGFGCTNVESVPRTAHGTEAPLLLPVASAALALAESGGDSFSSSTSGHASRSQEQGGQRQKQRLRRPSQPHLAGLQFIFDVLEATCRGREGKGKASSLGSRAAGWLLGDSCNFSSRLFAVCEKETMRVIDSIPLLGNSAHAKSDVSMVALSLQLYALLATLHPGQFFHYSLFTENFARVLFKLHFGLLRCVIDGRENCCILIDDSLHVFVDSLRLLCVPCVQPPFLRSVAEESKALTASAMHWQSINVDCSCFEVCCIVLTLLSAVLNLTENGENSLIAPDISDDVHHCTMHWLWIVSDGICKDPLTSAADSKVNRCVFTLLQGLASIGDQWKGWKGSEYEEFSDRCGVLIYFACTRMLLESTSPIPVRDFYDRDLLYHLIVRVLLLRAPPIVRNASSSGKQDEAPLVLAGLFAKGFDSRCLHQALCRYAVFRSVELLGSGNDRDSAQAVLGSLASLLAAVESFTAGMVNSTVDAILHSLCMVVSSFCQSNSCKHIIHCKDYEESRILWLDYLFQFKCTQNVFYNCVLVYLLGCFYDADDVRSCLDCEPSNVFGNQYTNSGSEFKDEHSSIGLFPFPVRFLELAVSMFSDPWQLCSSSWFRSNSDWWEQSKEYALHPFPTDLDIDENVKTTLSFPALSVIYFLRRSDK